MNRQEIKQALKNVLRDGSPETVQEEEGTYKSYYLGTYMELDPCGKYHHVISPNGVKKTCIRFWDNLELAAEELKGYIAAGEGNATDIYFIIPEEN